MSGSEVGARRSEFAGLVSRLASLIDAALDPAQPDVICQQDVSRLMTNACRLYSSYFQGPQATLPVTDLELSPTQAVNAAAALLRSQQLTPFEFAVWFSGGMPLDTER